MNAYLEETVAKYLHPSDDYISLTEIARKFDAKNPSYLIQSWLRNRNTVKFLATWERNNKNIWENTMQIRQSSIMTIPIFGMCVVSSIKLSSIMKKPIKLMKNYLQNIASQE